MGIKQNFGNFMTGLGQKVTEGVNTIGQKVHQGLELFGKAKGLYELGKGLYAVAQNVAPFLEQAAALAL
jgi:hypothetical protein